MAARAPLFLAAQGLYHGGLEFAGRQLDSVGNVCVCVFCFSLSQVVSPTFSKDGTISGIDE